MRHPFEEAEVYGDIVLTRSGKDGEPMDFTLNEYNAYTGEDNYVGDDDDDDDEEEEEMDDDEEDDEEDDDDEDDDAFLERLSEEITQEFIAAQGREPTESEMMALLVVRANQPQDDDQEEEDEDEDEVEVEENSAPKSKGNRRKSKK